jgi:hypothetical protein
MRLFLPAITVVLLAACQPSAPPADAADSADSAAASPSPDAAPPPPAAPPVDTAPAFVDAVWRAEDGSGVETGTTYEFRRDGTLVVSSPHGTPLQGAWRLVDGALTMTEDGVDYATDVVAQDADHLHLRSHNPGGAVELVLVRVP